MTLWHMPCVFCWCGVRSSSCTFELSSQEHHKGTTWPNKLLEGFLELSPHHPNHGDVPMGCRVALHYSIAKDLLLSMICSISLFAIQISELQLSLYSLFPVVKFLLTIARFVTPTQTFWVSCLLPHRKDLNPLSLQSSCKLTQATTWVYLK